MYKIQYNSIYEDDELVVCHKPAGVLSQSAKGFDLDMVSALMTNERKKGVSKPFIAPVNRLDRPVEGLILFAKNSESAARLTSQITSGEVDKFYYAVVQLRGTGLSKGDEGELVDWLVKDPKTNTSSVADSGTKGAKEARLSYTCIDVQDDLALLYVKLFTGRHHQIRVQLSHHGMPILGDMKYGSGSGKDVPALCSSHLEFRHPSSGEKLVFNVTPMGEAFKKFRISERP